MKNRLLVIALLGLCLSASAQKSKTINGMKFRPISATEAELYDGKKAEGDVVIPEYVEIDKQSYRVTTIGSRAFSIPKKKYVGTLTNFKVTSVTFPPSIRVIGSYAFYKCCELREAIIPDSCRHIGSSAFYNCHLTRIVLPEGLKYIGSCAFEEWARHDALDEIIIPNSVDTIGYRAFPFCKRLVVPDKEPHIIADDKGDDRIVTGYVSGHTVSLPVWVGKRYGKRGYKHIEAQMRTFSFYAQEKLPPLMEQWQQKGELETTAQWRQRMSDDNRLRQQQQFLEQLQAQYIAERRPKAATATARLGRYNADVQQYAIVFDADTIMVPMEVTQARAFKERFAQATLTPHYGIVADSAGVTSCTITFDGQTLQAVNPKAKGLLTPSVSLAAIDLNRYGDATSGVPTMTAPATVESVDIDIPATATTRERTFAVVIGNERYQRVSPVEYAQRDAHTFADYCRQTLGLPEKNVRLYENATYGTMVAAISDLKDVVKAFNGDVSVIVYYAGHGVPDENTKEAFLLPADGDPSTPEACYATSRLYQELGQLQARQVTVLLDACFSGTQRGQGMLMAARGVALKAKAPQPQGRMVVLSAATADQTAYPYRPGGHGLFTYYLLRQLKATGGSCTLGQLADYVVQQVGQTSVLENGKPQTPQVAVSPTIADIWKELHF